MYWKNKKVLVTGGGGVIGREFIKKLVSRESEVVCLDRVEKLEDIADSVEYHLINISELEPEDIAAFQPEVIVHLAAAFERTEETPEFWDENYRDNVVVSHKVIEAAKMCNKLECFVFASSYLIYSPELCLFEHFPNEPKKLTENDKIDPRNLCGAAKYYAEKELEFRRTRALNTKEKIFSKISIYYNEYGKDYAFLLKFDMEETLRHIKENF